MNIASGQNAMDAGVEGLGDPSAFACPDCHGVLLRVKDAGPRRFRCHTGHAYSIRSLVAAMESCIDDTLWSAVRALEEGALLMQQLANSDGSPDPAADDFDRRASEAHEQADAVRNVAQQRLALNSSTSHLENGDE